MTRRVSAIAGLVPRCALAAEIGADHGAISAHLLETGVCDRMIVSDISAASLDKARRLFARRGLANRAEFRVADGLAALSEPVDAIVIAGMGAKSIARILSGNGCLKTERSRPFPTICSERSRPFPTICFHVHSSCAQTVGSSLDSTAILRQSLILQPSIDPPLLRRWLAERGFMIEDEALALEDGRFYVALRAVRGEAVYDARALLLGNILLKKRPEGFVEYLQWRRDCLRAARDEASRAALEIVEEELHACENT